MRKPTHGALKRKADALWSKLVRERADNKCELCGKTENLQAHHVFGRRAMSTRYDPLNGCSLCWRCHFVEAEQNSTRFGVWLIDRRGREWFDKLNREHNRLVKLDMDCVIEELEKGLDEARIKNKLCSAIFKEDKNV